MRRVLPLALAVLCCAAAPAGAQDLTTRWGAELDRSDPRPEHPRPQAVRTRWRSLNGSWEFGFGAAYDRDILVPFPFEAPLSGIGRGAEVFERVRYRRRFRVPAAWGDRRVLLHFGAVDHEATVRVNGRVVGRHRGGYDPFSLDVTGALRGRDRAQTVEVLVRDPAGADATQPLGKQRAKGRIFYTRSTGIWQSVWLEGVDADHLADFDLRPDLGAGRLRVDAILARAGADEVRVSVRRRGRAVASASAPVGGSTAQVDVPVPSPEPWSPESPALYDVTLRLLRAGRTVDRVESYTAFRTVAVRNGFFELNGRPYVLRGVLDQGYWPDGVYTAPSDAALRHDVRMAKAYGFNLARKHVKVEDPRWYWHADRLGLLVAQDMPSSWDVRSQGAQRRFAAEWQDMITTLDGHPSIALWIAFNENWGRPSAVFQDAIVDQARALDPTRPIVDASGSVRRENSDMTDFHDYREDLARYQVRRRPRRARWIGEYGGLTLRVPGHIWHGGRGFRRRVRSVDGLVREYRQLTDQVNGTPGLSGYVYTQLYDVERELNGLMTYDRLSKLDPGRIAAVNRAR